MNSNVIGPVNIGNDDEFTIIELANLIIQKIDPSLKIVLKGYLWMILYKENLLLISQKRTWLGAKINLNNGLDKTINYFKKIILLNDKIMN